MDLEKRCLFDTRNGTGVEAESLPGPTLHIDCVAFSPSTCDPFKGLLDDFPSLKTPCTSHTPVKHGVAHYIVTEGCPFFAWPCRLLPEKLVAAKAEFNKLLTWASCVFPLAHGLLCFTWFPMTHVEAVCTFPVPQDKQALHQYVGLMHLTWL